jgi:sporulation protein YlmC with PRC-barrel domain
LLAPPVKRSAVKNQALRKPKGEMIMSQNAENIVHNDYSRPYRRVLSASTLAKDSVRNQANEDVGSIKEIMLDVPSGRVAYAVLSVGGFLGLGDRLFAIPWEALTLDEDRQCFIMDVDNSALRTHPVLTNRTGQTWPTHPGATASISIGRDATITVLEEATAIAVHLNGSAKL